MFLLQSPEGPTIAEKLAATIPQKVVSRGTKSRPYKNKITTEKGPKKGSKKLGGEAPSTEETNQLVPSPAVGDMSRDGDAQLGAPAPAPAPRHIPAIPADILKNASFEGFFT